MKNNDIKIDNEYGKFKFRVNGIVTHNNDVLLVKMQNNSFYCLPGGHVKIGEDSQNAVIREIKEETGYDTQISELVSLTENFFNRKNGTRIHELGFYYLLNLEQNEKIIETKYETVEDNEDNVKLQLEWIPISELDKIEFRPYELKQKIQNMDSKLKHIIIK